MTLDDLFRMADGAAGKEAADLSDLDKVAIAVASGCDIELAWDDHRAVIRSRWPVDIRKENGEWIITEVRR